MKLKKLIRPFLNIKFLIAFGLAWMITNGWCYVFIGLGTIFKIKLLTTIGATYLAFLWMPFTIEKLITIPLAIFFQTKLFPKDKKLNQQLQDMYSEIKKVKYDMEEKRHWKKMKKILDKNCGKY